MPDATSPRVGRPRASSRQTLAEAACELFLERGYTETSVADITTRAGVSRSSFFNYFASKEDVLWVGFDERVDAASTRLTDRRVPVAAALTAIGAGFRPDSLALAIVNADAMGLREELARERAIRHGELSRLVAARLQADGVPGLRAQVRAAAAAGAVLASVWVWAGTMPGRTALYDVLVEAVGIALPD